MRLTAAILLTALAIGRSGDGQTNERTLLYPAIEGDWWRVAGNPDLGDYTGENQQPVDFGVWQAADGTWQLWSCIRGTKCGGNTRLFHRWEGSAITDPDWRPMGIAMEADPTLGEQPGGLQAPHVVRWQGRYHMAYGDWNHICFATSTDGKSFRRSLQDDGQTGVFTEGPNANTRDAMLLFSRGRWYGYYTAFPNGMGYVYCRTSPDLATWSDSCVVAYGGSAGRGPLSCECAHVVEPQPGVYFLFRTQRYGADAQTTIYRSESPLNFGIDHDAKLVTRLPIAAPEIVQHEGRYYIAALTPELDGVRIARLAWRQTPRGGTPVFDFEDADARTQWTWLGGNLSGDFTTSTRAQFDPPSQHFIGTAEFPGNLADDRRKGVVESPTFTIAWPLCTLHLSGGADMERLYVAIVDAETGDEWARFTGTGDNHLRPIAWDCETYRGRQARIRIVDDSDAPWGHINFGGLYSQEP